MNEIQTVVFILSVAIPSISFGFFLGKFHSHNKTVTPKEFYDNTGEEEFERRMRERFPDFKGL